MDPDAVAGMIFTLLLLLMVAGFILVYPLSRRVAALVERRLHDKELAPQPNDAEMEALRQAITDLSAQLDRVVDRQDFMEKLLSQRMDPRPLGTLPHQALKS
jgi:hypothetical protein